MPHGQFLTHPILPADFASMEFRLEMFECPNIEMDFTKDLGKLIHIGHANFRGSDAMALGFSTPLVPFQRVATSSSDAAGSEGSSGSETLRERIKRLMQSKEGVAAKKAHNGHHWAQRVMCVLVTKAMPALHFSDWHPSQTCL